MGGLSTAAARSTARLHPPCGVILRPVSAAAPSLSPTARLAAAGRVGGAGGLRVTVRAAPPQDQAMPMTRRVALASAGKLFRSASVPAWRVLPARGSSRRQWLDAPRTFAVTRSAMRWRAPALHGLVQARACAGS